MSLLLLFSAIPVSGTATASGIARSSAVGVITVSGSATARGTPAVVSSGSGGGSGAGSGSGRATTVAVGTITVSGSATASGSTQGVATGTGIVGSTASASSVATSAAVGTITVSGSATARATTGGLAVGSGDGSGAASARGVSTSAGIGEQITYVPPVTGEPPYYNDPLTSGGGGGLYRHDDPNPPALHVSQIRQAIRPTRLLDETPDAPLPTVQPETHYAPLVLTPEYVVTPEFEFVFTPITGRASAVGPVARSRAFGVYTTVTRGTATAVSGAAASAFRGRVTFVPNAPIVVEVNTPRVLREQAILALLKAGLL